jgi:hypothetical protein
MHRPSKLRVSVKSRVLNLYCGFRKVHELLQENKRKQIKKEETKAYIAAVANYNKELRTRLAKSIEFLTKTGPELRNQLVSLLAVVECYFPVIFLKLHSMLLTHQFTKIKLKRNSIHRYCHN